MHLTPREQEGLLIYVAADLARRRQARGLKLNYPESVALISEAMIEAARDGRRVEEAIQAGMAVLNPDDVLDGVPEMATLVQVEATFPDGTKLASCHDPIGRVAAAGDAASDDSLISPGTITLNDGRPTAELNVANTGDRPIQVGSHAHFFEVNAALRFDRAPAYGMHLDIPAGTAVRFEPGDEQTVTLSAFAGDRRVFGMNAFVNGPLDNVSLDDDTIRAQADRRARDAGFIHE